MVKLCVSLVVLGMMAILSDAQSITSPFPSPPRNPFLADHLRRNGYYNRNVFDNTYQRNYFNRVFKPQVRTDRFSDKEARIISHNLDSRHDGSYQYVYETENGIRGQERGVPRNLRSGEPTENVEGSYTYTSPEGLKVLVEYTADENGFRPQISYGGVGADRFINSLEPASVVIQRRI